MKLSDTELRQATINAAAARLSVRAYLATVGCAPVDSTRDGVPDESDRDREVLVNLMRLHRIMRGAATNLNQAVAKWHSTNEQPAEFQAIAEYVRRVATQVDDLIATIRPGRR